MRTLVVSAWNPTRSADGAGLLLGHHLRRWQAEHELTVLTSDRQGGGGTVPPQVAMEVHAGAEPRGVGYARRLARAALTGRTLHEQWVASPGLLRSYERHLAEGSYDVVHLFGWGTAPLADRAAAAGVPAVHMAVDPWGRNHANRPVRGLRRLLERGEASRVRAHERRWYPACHAVVVVTPQDADALRAAVPRARFVAVPNGVEPGPPPTDLPSAPVLGFHGAFEARANHDAALVLVDEVLPRVRRAVEDARARVIGRDPAAELRARASATVEVTGWVDDVRAELDRVAVYVAPMVSGTGIKNKVLEAMAAGRPVVATPLALQGIGVGDGVVQAAGPDEMAQAAVELLQAPERAASTGRAGRERVVSSFTWAASADAVAELWEAAVSG